MLQVVSPADPAVNSQLGVVAQAGPGGYGAPANKLQRSDRIEVSTSQPFFFPNLYYILGFKISSFKANDNEISLCGCSLFFFSFHLFSSRVLNWLDICCVLPLRA